MEHQHQLHPTYETLSDAQRHILLILDGTKFPWPGFQNVRRQKVKRKLSRGVAVQLLHDKQFKLPLEPEFREALLLPQVPRSRPEHRDDRHRSPDHGYGYYRPYTRDPHRTRSPSPRRGNYYRSRTEKPRYSYHTRSPLPSPYREADRVATSRRYLHERSLSPPTPRHPLASTSDRSALQYEPTAYHTEPVPQSISRQSYQPAIAKDAYQDRASQFADDQNYEAGATEDDSTELSKAEFESKTTSTTESDRLRQLQTSVPSTAHFVTNMTFNNHHLLIDVTQGAMQASTLLNVVFGRKPPARDASVWRSHQQALYKVSYQAGKGKLYSKLFSNLTCRIQLTYISGET